LDDVAAGMEGSEVKRRALQIITISGAIVSRAEKGLLEGKDGGTSFAQKLAVIEDDFRGRLPLAFSASNSSLHERRAAPSAPHP